MGREVRETHEHYDVDGNLTGTTVVTRESEWDDEQRNHILEWFRYKALTRRCGHHPSTGANKNLGRVVDHGKHECFDCQMVEKAREDFHRAHASRDEKPEAKSRCPICADEDFWIASYLTPDDVSLRDDA